MRNRPAGRSSDGGASGLMSSQRARHGMAHHPGMQGGDMTSPFIVDTSAVPGRAAIRDTMRGRLVGFFLADPDKPDAAERIAAICAERLNEIAAGTAKHGGEHASQ